MSQFDDKINRIMQELILSSSHEEDEDDKEKDKEDTKDKDKKKKIKDQQFPWDRGGINERKECPPGYFWCPIDMKCVKDKVDEAKTPLMIAADELKGGATHIIQTQAPRKQGNQGNYMIVPKKKQLRTISTLRLFLLVQLV